MQTKRTLKARQFITQLCGCMHGQYVGSDDEQSLINGPDLFTSEWQTCKHSR